MSLSTTNHSKPLKKQSVVIALSGGVDSSVAALLLKKEGYDVTALFMKNWEDDPHCPAEKDYEDALKVCELLDIPLYTVNFAKEYWDNVFSTFIEGLKKGHTPNPDILCNKEIKFHCLLNKALSLGAEFLATGHYCQKVIKDNKSYLAKGRDPGKDQSYFLYTIKSSILEKVLFPIGHLEKSHVRELAKEHNIPTHDKKDSTGICFIGKRKFRDFINRYIPYQKGAFENLTGDKIGEHLGVAYYTIGQRKGLNIGGPGDAWFVIGKDITRNVVIVEQGHDHPSLYSQELIAKEISWVEDIPKLPFTCKAKIRYRQEEVPCTVTQKEHDLLVSFKDPVRAVTPFQSIVFYDENICLGGGIIASILETSSTLSTL